MKYIGKIILIPTIVLLLMFMTASVVSAETDDTDSDSSAEELVSLVIGYYEDGLTKEEIAEKLEDYIADLLDDGDDDDDDSSDDGDDDDDSSDDGDDDNDSSDTLTKQKKLNFGQFKKSLRSGSAGEDVIALQESLNELAIELGLNFPQLNPDGKFGALTARAVRLFQIHQRIGADGIVGAKTLEQLQKFFDDDGDDEDDDTDDSDDDDGDDDDDDDDGDDDDS